MRTFTEAVKFAVENAAGHAFSQYMGGSNEYRKCLSQAEVDLIAHIYERPVDAIHSISERLVENRFDELVALQCARYRTFEGQ